MKVHQYREMMRYLTRKPLPPMPAAPAEIPETSDERFSKDVEFIDKVQTQGDTQNEIGTGTEGDPGTEVDQDMIVYPKQILPKNAEPTMPSEEGIPDPKYRQIELATGGRVELAEGMNPNATMDANEGAIKTAKEWYEKHAPQDVIKNSNEKAIKTAKEWYEKHAPKVTDDIAKGASKTLRVISTPAVSTALYIEDVYSDLKKAAEEGNITASKTLDAIVGKGEKGLYFMLPELAKDVVTNPIVSKILQLGSLGRVATPVGAALTATGLGKDIYDQYQEFKALPQEQKETIKKQLNYGATDEMGNRVGEANGGRIGYKKGSEDNEDELPTLGSEDEYFGKKIKDIPERDTSGPRVGFMNVKKRKDVTLNTSEEEGGGATGGIRELKQLLLNNVPQVNPTIGYGGENYNTYISKGINPYGDKGLRYGASYSPEGSDGSFSIDKGPGYIGAGYGYEKDNLKLGIGALRDKIDGNSINLNASYKF